MNDDLPRDHEKLLYQFKPFIVPGLINMGEIPEEYAVFELPDEGSLLYGGCIIYGKYNGKWHANASARALVTHLLSELDRLERLNDDKFNTIQAYCRAASEDKAMIRELLQALELVSDASYGKCDVSEIDFSKLEPALVAVESAIKKAKEASGAKP